MPQKMQRHNVFNNSYFVALKLAHTFVEILARWALGQPVLPTQVSAQQVAFRVGHSGTSQLLQSVVRVQATKPIPIEQVYIRKLLGLDSNQQPFAVALAFPVMAQSKKELAKINLQHQNTIDSLKNVNNRKASAIDSLQNAKDQLETIKKLDNNLKDVIIYKMQVENDSLKQANADLKEKEVSLQQAAAILKQKNASEAKKIAVNQLNVRAKTLYGETLFPDNYFNEKIYKHGGSRFGSND
ncbi:MAG: hypothetical protein EZS28_044163, partial [Streblomastix strix]